MKTNKTLMGKIYIVGAGPGDPELLTMKAYTVLQSAHIVFVDRLVSKEIRNLIPSRSTVVEVGKAPGQHSVPQEEISAGLIDAASKGFDVCRLKGGDPFVFGRGGEEQQAAQQAGLEVEVVPGITAAAGCAAAAGIPLTHRGLSQAVTLVTAQAADELNINWRALAAPDQTLVFYMGIRQAGQIQTQLVSRGLAPTTTLAIIENGTRPEQRIFHGQLGQLRAMVEQNQIASPALVVIGEVTRLGANADNLTSLNALAEEFCA